MEVLEDSQSGVRRSSWTASLCLTFLALEFILIVPVLILILIQRTEEHEVVLALPLHTHLHLLQDPLALQHQQPGAQLGIKRGLDRVSMIFIVKESTFESFVRTFCGFEALNFSLEK